MINNSTLRTLFGVGMSNCWMVLISLALSSHAHSEEKTFPAGIIRWDDAKQISGFAPQAIQKAADSVLFVDNNSACSTQQVAPAGFALTALHCAARSLQLGSGPGMDMKVGESVGFKAWSIRDFSRLPYRTEDIPNFYIKLRIQSLQGEPLVLTAGKGYFEVPPLIESENDYSEILKKRDKLQKFQE
ncbi:MAG: hypothetical protein ACXVA9_13340, partial [Bdellovibrionales bacterium]